MADVVLVFIAFVLLIAGAVTAGLMIRAARIAEAKRRAQLPPEAQYLDSYTDRLNQAQTVADIERLEKERKSQRWDGSS